MVTVAKVMATKAARVAKATMVVIDGGGGGAVLVTMRLPQPDTYHTT